MTGRILVLGHSPTLSYLGWVFSGSNYHLTVCLLKKSVSKTGPEPWLLFRPNIEDPLVFHPNQTYETIEQLSMYNGPAFDFVFFDYYYWQHYKNTLMKMIGFGSIILVDVREDPWLYEKVQAQLSQYAVLAISSEIDCRIINENLKVLQLVCLGEMRIGVPMAGIQNPLTFNAIEIPDSIMGAKLSDLTLTYKKNHENQHWIKIISYGFHEKLIRVIWKKLFTMMCFHVPTVIFGDHNLNSLKNIATSKNMMQEIFQELILICNELKIEGISNSLFGHLNLLENLKEWNRIAAISNKPFLPSSIIANPLYYDFSQGRGLNIGSILSNISSLNMELKQFSSISLIFTILFHIRFGQSNLFQLKRNKSPFTQTGIVNGILPNKNMMNYAPFNPLPPPVFIGMVLIDEKDEYEDLKDLIKGTEDFTYGEEFHDAPPAPPQQSLPPAPPQALPAPPQSLPLPPPQALHPPALPAPFPTKHRTKKPFVHMHPITYTNSEMLRSHTEMLDALKFNRLMDTSTSSRYGDLDTSTAILHSANSSRGSGSSFPKKNTH
ncbi:hypothetical protein HYPBUDRAFT_151072 [Hyphopichia burtonii NRRL Y-1933]|uniref:Ketopantoate reductase C-terminal domain-containing protein n=1 Tax=Hyphopichia burtonii NRRL Y-1933 TaxID=984485 RepID=A0A1E4RBY8_9ASCO|nr:hypothetical protein HYPBUDRAFT_151072 [Hyphopichia burtonii NRRL Y-1933]ODV64760.1 hypothetical protein HYPBUDRAFT_151072 [Hyphopichia burtonii NRRL Y-1933]